MVQFHCDLLPSELLNDGFPPQIDALPHNYDTRHAHESFIEPIHIVLDSNTSKSQEPQLWNHLPSSLHNLSSIVSFKSSMNKILILLISNLNHFSLLLAVFNLSLQPYYSSSKLDMLLLHVSLLLYIGSRACLLFILCVLIDLIFFATLLNVRTLQLHTMHLAMSSLYTRFTFMFTMLAII